MKQAYDELLDAMMESYGNLIRFDTSKASNSQILYACGDGRIVLAFCGHRLDISIPVVLSDTEALR